MSSIKICRLLAVLCRRSSLLLHTGSRITGRNNAFIHNTKKFFDSCNIEIKMPSLSPTMTEGTIVKWLKKEGDSISPGDVLCEIQTDKAVVGLETEEEGILTKILVPEDTKNVQLGELIAIISGEGSSDSTGGTPEKKQILMTKEEAIETEAVLKATHDSPRLIGPSVRKLFEDYGIEYSMITGSGPSNIVLKGDVLSYIKSKNVKQKSFVTEKNILPKTPDVTFIEKQSYIDIPLTSMRKTIAKRLTESKTTIPHAYVSADCKIDAIMKLRKQLKEDGISVSMNDFVIKCAASVLNKIPNINVVNVDSVPKKMQTIDISVAVATENGLITPIVKNANELSVTAISQEVKSLAQKAREGSLKPEEFQGGSFTISNLGMFGISEFCAVINPPQGAILAVGSARSTIEAEHFVQKMRVTLSYDSRIIHENDAGQFLNYFKLNMENPANILL